MGSVSDVSEEVIRRELTEISQRHSGQLRSLNPTNGSAVLQFPSLEHANLFKQRFIHHKIGNRRINVHWGPKTPSRGKSPGNQQRSSSRAACAADQQQQQRSRCKSFSQSPGPGPTPRSRTYSECERKTSGNTEHVSSSQESTGADVMVESLVLRSSRPRLVSESSLTADVSSGEDEVNRPRHIRRPPAKIRSMAKLKNRKKSEATTEFLSKKTSLVGTVSRQEQENWNILAEVVVDLLEQEPDFCLDVDQLEELLGDQVNLLGSPRGSLKGADLKAKLGDNIEVRGNLVTLPLARLCAPLESRLVNLLHETPSQVIAMEKIEEAFTTSYGSNFKRMLEVQNLPNLSLLLASCQNLALMEDTKKASGRGMTPTTSKVVTLLTSDMVSAHLRKVTNLVHQLTKERQTQQISATDLERAWTQREGRTRSLQLSVLARRSELTVSAGWVALPDHMKHGYKLVELLTSVGGVAPIATLSSQHGQEVKAALAALDRLELLVRRRGDSVMLEELWRQLQGAAGASPGVDGAATAAVGGGGGRSSRQEELGSAFPDLVAAIPGVFNFFSKSGS